MTYRPLTATLLALAVTGSATAAEATLEERVKALEAKLLEVQKGDGAAKPKAVGESGTTADGKNGFTIASDDGKYSLKIWGYLQGEGRFFLADDEEDFTNTFVLRRARLVAEGQIGLFDFRLMPDFGNGQTVLQDAYIGLTVNKAVRAQVGRFKVPIGLEHLQSDTNTAFIERGFPTQLVPGRDIGAMVSGSVFDGRLSYQAGIFNGATDGANRDGDNGDDKEGVARLMVTPFAGGAAELASLTVGIAGSYTREEGVSGSAASSALPSFRTSGQNVFFSYDTANVEAHGEHTRIAPQLYYAIGPVGVLGEYTISQQEVRSATENEDIRNQGWQVCVTVSLTGEAASYKGISPASPLTLDGGSWGAWELVARVQQLDIDDDVYDLGFADEEDDASEATAFAIGVNWTMSRQVRLMLDYELTTFDGGAGAPGAIEDREDEHVIATRVQLVF
jgi:phosphate-selective porin OprO/OprP